MYRVHSVPLVGERGVGLARGRVDKAHKAQQAHGAAARHHGQVVGVERVLKRHKDLRLDVVAHAHDNLHRAPREGGGLHIISATAARETPAPGRTDRVDVRDDAVTLSTSEMVAFDLVVSAVSVRLHDVLWVRTQKTFAHASVHAA